jgi:hypothetical protein
VGWWFNLISPHVWQCIPPEKTPVFCIEHGQCFANSSHLCLSMIGMLAVNQRRVLPLLSLWPREHIPLTKKHARKPFRRVHTLFDENRVSICLLMKQSSKDDKTLQLELSYTISPINDFRNRSPTFVPSSNVVSGPFRCAFFAVNCAMKSPHVIV